MLLNFNLITQCADPLQLRLFTYNLEILRLLTSSKSLLTLMECTTPLVSILFRSHSSLSLSICWRCADTLRLRLFSICSSLRATYSALAPRNGSASSASPKIDWKSVICVFVYEVDTQNCLDMNSVCWNLTTFRIEQSTSSPAERRTFFSRLHPQTACVF